MFASTVLAVLLAQPRPVPPRPPAEPLPVAPGKQEGPAPAPLPAQLPGPRIDDDGIEIAGVDAGVVRVPSSDSAWGGVRTGRERTLSERVADYEFDVVLDPVRHTVEGRERLTWRNRSDRAVRHLWMHLYLNAFEGEGSTFAMEWRRYGSFGRRHHDKGEYGYTEIKKLEQRGKSARWSFQHPDGGPETDHTVIRVDLPEPVRPGASTELDIEFFDQLPRVVARTGYFDGFHLVAQWFPKVGVLELPGERGATRPRWNCHEFHHLSEFYADFGSYRARITAPKGHSFGSTGQEVAPPEETPLGVRRTVAQDDVHDFAFALWDKFALPLMGTYEGDGGPKVGIKVLFGPEHEASARLALDATRDSLAYFSRTLGPYPYPQVTVVLPPRNAWEASGMEYETFYTSIGAIGPPYLGMVRYVTVHEFGHGYFMGILASNEFEEPLLDEGLDELWGARMLSGESLQITLPFLRTLGIRTPPISTWDYERLNGASRFPADPIAGNAWTRYSEGSYGLVYGRAVLVFHDLEKLLPEGVFARGMREFYRRWRYRHPSTADLEKALADTAGPDAGVVHRWFAEQVYDSAPVDDRVEIVDSAEALPQAGLVRLEDGSREERDEQEVQKQIRATREAFRKQHREVKRGQPGPFPWRSLVQARRYAAHVPQTLLIGFEDGSQEHIAWPAGERWRRFVLERPTRAAFAQLDPVRAVLLDVNKLDDGRTRERDSTASWRWTLEITAWIELLYAFVEAL